MVGVPFDIASGGRAGIDVPVPFVIGYEVHPGADPHGSCQASLELDQLGELPGTLAVDPQLPGGATPISLPPCGIRCIATDNDSPSRRLVCDRPRRPVSKRTREASRRSESPKSPSGRENGCRWSVLTSTAERRLDHPTTEVVPPNHVKRFASPPPGSMTNASSGPSSRLEKASSEPSGASAGNIAEPELAVMRLAWPPVDAVDQRSSSRRKHDEVAVNRRVAVVTNRCGHISSKGAG